MVLTDPSRIRILLPRVRSQSPPNRVNGSHCEAGVADNHYLAGRNPLLIGSMVLTSVALIISAGITTVAIPS